MTDDDFAKSIGATPVNSQSDEDFAKSIGATKVDPGFTQSNTPGVPSKPNVDLSAPSTGNQTFSDKYLPWWMNYSHSDTDMSGLPILRDMKDIHSASDLNQYLGDLGVAGVRSVAHMGTGILDTINNPIASAMGLPENGITNALDNVTSTPNARQQSQEGQINEALGSLDPQMIMPYAHPTTPGLGDWASSRKILSDRPTNIPPQVQPEVPVPQRGANPIANQSDLPGGPGAMDNIRRQLSGEIQPNQDITNTPMERMTDSLLNNRDQAAMQGSMNMDQLTQLLEQQKAAQRDAMDRATQGITYENIPPDGSIPGNSPSRGITVPRNLDTRWSAPDENGIPVRQDLPQVTEPTEVQNVSNQTPHANDLGNAIQEANGPKLGPDEIYGAGQLPRTYMNSQRGSIALGGDDFFNNLKRWFTGSPEEGRTSSYSLEEQSARKNAELQHAGPGQYITMDRDLAGVYGGPNGRAYQVHEPFKNSLDFNSTKDWGNGIKQSGDKYYKSLVDQYGSKSAANAQLKKQGFDAITFTSPRGEKIANIFNPAKLTDIGPAREPMKDFGELSLVPKDTPSDRFNVAVERAQRGGYKGNQSGIIDGQLINGMHDLVSKAKDIIGGLMDKGQQKFASMLPDDHMAKVSGQDQVYRPESGEQILAKGLAQGKLDTSLWKNMQSGMKLAAEKTGSAILHGAADWLHWTDKRTVLDNRKTVDPVHKQIKSLNQNDYQTLHKIMLREQGTRTLTPDSTLRQSLSPKAVEAYKALRQAFENAYQRSVQTRAALGLPPMSREAAYHASMHYGDWRQSFYDKSGQLVWHVASSSRLEAMKAASWIKNNHPNIDWNKSSKALFKPETSEAGVPRDVMSAYQDMMRFFDPDHPVTKAISDSIAKYNQEHGITSKGFDQRFLDKSNIPGFEGNKPWLSEKQNSEAFFNAQMKYLRDSNHWNNLQEAMANLKPILKNEDLIRNQPNIMETMAAHLNRELGINSNKLAAIESAWAKYYPKIGMIEGKPTVALGISRGNVYKGVADVKAGTYLTMLGANIPYMITTPLQAVMSIAQHRYLSEQGFSHNAAKTVVNSIGDIAAGLGKHIVSSMAGKPVDLPISDVGSRMLKYAEDNGILDKTVMDETGSTRTHAILDPIKATLGKTITAPEKVARWSTFVGFAHHLIDSGLPESRAFQMAEDFTNHSLTSMRRSDKPLIVDKLGTAGQLGYVFKSYLFNEYNQLAQFANMAREGIAQKNTSKLSPMLLHLGTLFALGGALAMPGINELDGAYNIFKNIMSEHAPSFFKDDIGLKGKIIRDMPTWASIGTVSQLTGTNLGSRFNTQMTNLENPLGDVAVPIQEGKELASFGKVALDPTKENTINAIHANAGATIKGAMETHLDAYKNLNKSTPNGRNPDNTQTYIKASDINNPAADYKRTPEEEFKRSLGFYSDQEYKTKQLRYINNQEQERMKNAYTNLMEKAMSASKNGQLERAQNLSKAALKLIPDGDLYQSHIDSIAKEEGMTPEQRDIAHAQRLDDVMKVLRGMTPEQREKLSANH